MAAAVGTVAGNGTRTGFPAVLECAGVTAGYGDVQVLFGVDIHVERSEVVALMGANGAGKTTLLRVLSGLEPLWGGEVRLNANPVDKVPAYRRVSEGLCQIVGGESVAEGLTVAEHMRLWGNSLGRRGAVAQGRMADVYEVFPRLQERQSQVASTLSGGEKQMLALSKALIVHPDLLIIDEFSLGLAPIVVGELLPVIRRINERGSAVLMVEQSVNVALAVADRAYCMEKGAMVYEGSATELRQQPELLRSVYLEGVTAALSQQPQAGSQQPQAGGS
jgi:ABC-type branched-subunit amino acid transport system ATPase component